MASPTTTIAYSLRCAHAASAGTLTDVEQLLCAFSAGTRSVISGGRIRQDSLSGGTILIQQTPLGLLIVIDSSADFCTYRLVGRGTPPRLDHSKTTQAHVYPFDSWLSTTNRESAQSACAGVCTILWGNDATYITMTMYGQCPPDSAGACRAQREIDAGLGSPPHAPADLLVEVLREIQLSPTLGFGDTGVGAYTHPHTGEEEAPSAPVKN
ncbi:nuclear protein UL4 [Bovine alphaherpesvirus 2]|uniref:Nuclear protein UL4 n=1 Tax=Bovine alphaherpesvirus 2 TaxID=10295 RepID=A0ABX6WMC0_9ALPH|nr:nuclear protein UL4 [Bovine alphaherpesvirus 2]QPO25137.1 nuclear protein UL4 [Bovine alphaherpesvirus 2]